MNVHPGIANVLSTVPKRPRGRPYPKQEEAYQQWLRDWANGILRLSYKIGFKVSARGWCYILEEHGLQKGDFNTAEETINECRKAGYLPLNFCAEDVRRLARGLEDLDDDNSAGLAAAVFAGVDRRHESYTPFSFWDDKDCYIEMVVEKIDLVTLFQPVCEKFCIPIRNNVGWNDINSRVRTMGRFAEHQAAGRKCVLLYCGDFDPVGLQISTFLLKNMKDLEEAVNFELAQDEIDDLVVDDIEIKRFGLNYDFINENRLSWIPGLSTGSGKRLDDDRHDDYNKAYVQNYLKNYCPDWVPAVEPFHVGTGARKCEANALVVQPRKARKLCLQAILRYLHRGDPARYRTALKAPREALRQEIKLVELSRLHDLMTGPNSNRDWS